MDILAEKTLFNFPIPSEIFWIMLAAGIIFFFTFAWIFHHHWNYYGIEGNSKVFAKSLFWIGSIFLIFTMALAITAFETL